MKLLELATSVQAAHPNSDPTKQLQLALLVANSVDAIDELDDQKQFQRTLRDASMKLQFAKDQHSAVTEELEELAASDPRKFKRDQIWVLLRALKVQDQLLRMYAGGQPLDV